MANIETLRLNPQDNVAIMLGDVAKGDMISPASITAREPIPRSHKIAVVPIEAGAAVVKYGQIIGFASEHIASGAHVHVHNVSMGDFDRDYAYGEGAVETVMVPEAERATFQGYRREDGKVGTRNYIGIVTSVNCAATVALHVAKAVEKERLLDDYPNVDGIVPIVHGAGCCIGTDDEGFRMLQRTIWGHARHPNFASVLMLGLGCEANQIPFMLETMGKPSDETFHYTTIQQEGGTRKTVEYCLDWIRSVLPRANAMQRVTCPASELTVALQCGGSDGYSGLTANPALGIAVDTLVRHGGSGVLAETPEVYGAEHLLTRRAVSREVGEKLIERIHWWEEYAAKNNGSMNNNPTPGNKAGGLTTILEKSLGAVAKGGTTNLVGVYKYGEPITTKGFAFMDSPGYDPCSITGEVASGCNLVAFTTGRGSCYGNKPVPSVKLATNTPMYEHMSEDMDINCGTCIDGTDSLEDVGERIFRKLLSIASGERTLSEQLGFGDAEFVPWQIGAQM
jgi:altronate hydrolase